MRYSIVAQGHSRSFRPDDPFMTGTETGDTGEVVVYIGAPFRADASKKAILVELGTECLGAHTGEAGGGEGSNAVGFARYRNGDDPPSKLVELVRQTATAESAIAAARSLFEAHGLTVVVTSDQVGRIVDRLVRPKYNSALRLLDEGLATQEDMDLTCRLGLGYPDGPIERVVRGGLGYHYRVTRALFDVTGAQGFAPARRAVVAAARLAVKP